MLFINILITNFTHIYLCLITLFLKYLFHYCFLINKKKSHFDYIYFFLWIKNNKNVTLRSNDKK